MPETGDRLTDKAQLPDDAIVRDWLGARAHAQWTKLQDWIEASYPGVFNPDWLFAGQKHGWSLRYKKSKAFCTLIPEYRRLTVLVVLGSAERAKFEAAAAEFGDRLRALYRDAFTYHDGKWLKIDVPADAPLEELQRLLALKRRPRAAAP